MGDELLHEEALVTLCYTGTIGHPLAFLLSCLFNSV